MSIRSIQFNKLSTKSLSSLKKTLRVAKTITANGNAQISTAQFMFGGASAFFDGDGDFLSIAQPIGDLNFDSNDFTIEAWIYPTNVNQENVIISLYGYTNNRRAWYFGIANTGKLDFRAFNDPTGTGEAYPKSTASIVANVWTHVAVTKTGTQARFWINGQLDSTWTVASNIFINSIDPVYIGAVGPNLTGFYDGYIDELRISNTVRYTTNFTPATQPFTNDLNTLLLMHLNGANGSTILDDDISTENLPIQLLIAAGGGGSRNSNFFPGSGANGGSVDEYNNLTVNRGTYSITVGAGGASNTAGSNSSAFGYTVNGGATSVVGTGNGRGGFGDGDTNAFQGVNGGIGQSTFITNSLQYFGGGGGGYDQANEGTGGLGGGGRASGNIATSNGVSNTGGGAGNVSTFSGNGANGGSGVVIIARSLIQPILTTTGNPIITTDANYRYYTFNASGTIIF